MDGVLRRVGREEGGEHSACLLKQYAGWGAGRARSSWTKKVPRLH